jgi:hypothetical protein
VPLGIINYLRGDVTWDKRLKKKGGECEGRLLKVIRESRMLESAFNMLLSLFFITLIFGLIPSLAIFWIVDKDLSLLAVATVGLLALGVEIALKKL